MQSACLLVLVVSPEALVVSLGHMTAPAVHRVHVDCSSRSVSMQETTHAIGREEDRFFNLPVIVPSFIVRHCHRLTRLLIVLSRALRPFIHLAALPCKVVKTLASTAPPSISPSPLVALKIATRFVVLEVPRSLVRQCLLSSPVSQVLRRRPSSCLSPARRLRRFKSMIGSDIYQETLAKALAKHFGARLLIVDSLSLPGGTPSKEVDSAKESSKPERPSVLAKRSTHAASLKHSKPASSVDTEIVGGSTISSQAMLKQEVSTASSKGTTIKTGDRVKVVGNFPSAVSSIQNHPSRYCTYLIDLPCFYPRNKLLPSSISPAALLSCAIRFCPNFHLIVVYWLR
ncbi:hypothetical protein DS421_8g240010 [Arachis hypogaea]|nr:hypothetical protein DS421_8g240010 [Arachis hypogaea]